MDEILDQPLFNQAETTNVKYGGFWSRLGALILDGLALAPISFGVSYFNNTSWKSSVILVLITVVATGYKPFMEFMYGATWGKMAMNLKVVNTKFEQADLAAILFRNVFHILPSVVVLLFSLVIYNNPDFESVSGWGDYAKFIQQYSALRYINFATGLISIVDAIMLIADEQKRSLHDRIGNTLVIEQR